jgi:osmotically-inducible protein OsmY
MLCKAAGFGAAAMYFFDPDYGRRRRALVRDQLIGLSNSLARTWQAAREDFSNRATGLRYEAEHLFEPGDVPDDRLVERIRSRLGHFVYNPSGVEVFVNQGRVTLRGTIAANEVERAFEAVRWMPGVEHVQNELQVRPATEVEYEFARRGGFNLQGFSPSTQVGAAVAGTALLVYGTFFRRPIVSLLGSAAVGLATASCSGAACGAGQRRQGAGQPRGRQQVQEEWGTAQDREEYAGHRAAEFGRTESSAGEPMRAERPQTTNSVGTGLVPPGSAGPIAQPVMEGAQRPLVGEGHPHNLAPTRAEG